MSPHIIFKCLNCDELIAESSDLLDEHQDFQDCFVFKEFKINNRGDEIFENNFKSLSDCTFLEVKCNCNTTIGGLCIKAPPNLQYLKKCYVLCTENCNSEKISIATNQFKQLKSELDEMKKNIADIRNEFKNDIEHIKKMIFDLNISVMANTTDIIKLSQMTS